MTRIIAIIISAIAGYIIGIPIYLASDFVYAPLVSAAVFAISGIIMSASSGMGFTRSDAKVTNQAIDMVLVAAWGASPALKRLQRREERYLRAEEDLLNTTIPSGIKDILYNYEDLLFLIRESIRTGTEPFASLKRHNRAFRPGLFTKRSASYTVLQVVARIMLEAGADRRGAIWYYAFSKSLKVPFKDSHEFMEMAFSEQIRSPSMIPGFPDDESDLGKCSEGIKVTKEMEPYLDAFDRRRSQVLDIMFPDSSRAA